MMMGAGGEAWSSAGQKMLLTMAVFLMEST
jgi:hypothetical protein